MDNQSTPDEFALFVESEKKLLTELGIREEMQLADTVSPHTPDNSLIRYILAYSRSLSVKKSGMIGGLVEFLVN